MNKRTLLTKNLLHYRNAHLRTILGFAISTAILVGALIVGDSVRLSLRKMVDNRLGKITHTLQSNDRFITAELAGKLEKDTGFTIIPALQSSGFVSISSPEQKTQNVQILGVEEDFGKLSRSEDFYKGLGHNEVIVNTILANELNLNPGDELLIHIQKNDYIPRDVPLVSDEDLTFSRRFIIKRIAGIQELGHFSLRISQITPATVFISLDHLGSLTDIPERANLLLVDGKSMPDSAMSVLSNALSRHFTLEDAGLSLKKLTSPEHTELRSRRIFLGTPVEQAAKSASIRYLPSLTYFVNSIVNGDRSTPYSFVSGLENDQLPEDLHNDEIIINRWLADDLGLRVGDDVDLEYFILGEQRNLIEQHSSFRVHSIVPIRGMYADGNLMPDYPGLANEENCRNWDPGIPIDLEKIRPKDEEYWDNYRGVPKAFITYTAAKRIWGNRFGNLTSLRFTTLDSAHIRTQLTAELDPQSFGYLFNPVREQGLKATKESVDFSQLFIGLSFFIIVGALLLAALLFVFSIEKRSREHGLYLALGFKQRDVLRLALSEGVILAISGGILGIILAILYNRLILLALRSVWQDIVGTSQIHTYLQVSTISIGTFIAILISVVTILLVIRRGWRNTISVQQRGSSRFSQHRSKGKNLISMGLAVLCLLAGIFIVVTTNPGKSKDAAAAFFITGALVLTSGILFFKTFLDFRLKNRESRIPGLFSLAINNASRNKVRSLTLTGILASGLFIIFTVGSNQQGLQQDPSRRSSGTGGFELFAESLMPVLRNLNSDEDQEFYGLDQQNMDSVDVVAFRLREGDDASCLNLNRISRPRLLGIKPQELASKNAFSFVSFAEGAQAEDPWLNLEKSLSNDIIPGIADETVIIWGLGKSVGDTLVYFDENGEPFRIQLMAGLANSVFQGNLIISESNFVRKYPSVSGYRTFLIDTPESRTEAISDELSWALRNLGFKPVSTAKRLAEFNKVQNTYLSIFLILGGFGLILGTIGIAIVVLRNVHDRQNELALLQSVGFKKFIIQKLLFLEHGFMIITGILLGLSASFLAALPALISPDANVPIISIFVILLLITLNAGIWTYLATRSATSGNLLIALRNE